MKKELCSFGYRLGVWGDSIKTVVHAGMNTADSPEIPGLREEDDKFKAKYKV